MVWVTNYNLAGVCVYEHYSFERTHFFMKIVYTIKIIAQYNIIFKYSWLPTVTAV